MSNVLSHLRSRLSRLSGAANFLGNRPTATPQRPSDRGRWLKWGLPLGQVPTLVDGTTVLSDAQAILTYVARQYGGDRWLPLEPVALARVVRWLSTTAGEVRQGPESARLYHLFNAKTIDLDRANQKAEFILSQLDRHLSDRQWLELDRPTIADVAVFPYVALAPDGQIDLAPYPQVLAWIDRVKQLPGFVGMRSIEALTHA